MTRRLLASHLHHLLNPATAPNPKPFSFPTSQQNPFFQSRFLPWQLKPNRSLYFSGYKPMERPFLAPWRYIVQMRRLLTGGARFFCFSLQRKSGIRQKPERITRSHQILTPDRMVFLLLGANVAVHILWKFADPSFMKKHFMISLDNIKNSRFHTVITSAFSHCELGHLLWNLLGLESFGRMIAHFFGPKFLLKLYLGGAFSGSIFFLANHAFLDPYRGKGVEDISGPGASAAVNAMILFSSFLFPKELIYVYSFIPVPGAILGIGLIAHDVWRIYKGNSNVSGSAHLGGALVGILVFARLRKRV